MSGARAAAESPEAAQPNAAQAGTGQGDSGQGDSSQADMGQSDEELAAAWGAETDGAGAQVQPERVLNQAEIDSLLGFDGAGGDGESRTGMQQIISSGLVSYERLPMLEIVFDRLVRIMSTSLRNFTSDNVEVGIDNIVSLRFGDYLNSIPLPAMLAVFKAEEWDNYGLMVVDSAMIYSIVDVLLGGRRGTAAMRIEGRPYTTIERTLVERLIHVVLADLSVSFDPLCPVTFRFERLEVNPRFATISRLSNAAILARLRIDMEDRGGRLELLLPYATLEPVRELLLQQFMGEKFGRDSIWETHLAEELWNTDIDLDVVLDEQVMRLSDVMALAPGSQIVLGAQQGGAVQLRCGTVTLFEGKVGRRKNRVAVRIERDVPRPVQGEKP
ncbi:MAG: flagellar motor switch protein FliM [Rhodospirillales bacterium]|nr:flagellar motor switch protein FliM [Rhodospirillales bacterium]